LVFVKRIRALRQRGKQVKTPEAIARYLAKYLIKNFRLRANPAKAQKRGLLPGMEVYKFFRVGIKKPVQYPRVFINDEPDYRYQAERELAPHFVLDKEKKLRVKKRARQQAQTQAPPNKKSYSPIDFIKLCLTNASRAKVKNNPARKSCQDSPDENITGCVFNHTNHTEPINGAKAYDRFQQAILPALKRLNLPNFTKFTDYRPTDTDFDKFDELSTKP
jgi:hypothetical protein